VQDIDWRSPIITSTDVAIIGAGPYGLSIAAHLSATGVPFRIFGEPMQNWRTRMPKGMHLKSDGFASSLFDPERRFTLRRYCADKNIPYADLGLPVALETFTSYGMAFQKQFVPSLDRRLVGKLERAADGFKLTLSDGERLQARRVIIATGISYFEYLPDELAGLPRSRCTHSADNRELGGYKGREVLVLGRGASSTDIAALLLDQGASVQLVSREPVIFHLPPPAKPRSLWQRIKDPNLGLGPSFRSAVYTVFAAQFRFLPARLRQRIVRRHLGPAAVWFIRDKLVNHVSMRSGYTLKGAQAVGDRVKVQFTHLSGTTLELEVDHVIAGTGYQVDLTRLPFLDDALRSQIRLEGTSPALSKYFESSVPELYFVGLPSAVTFGPLTRFAFGAGFAAPRISAHLSRDRSKEAASELSRARP
jgi:cation diffusion facilitator CzcD-associated flavoprotein CzcO